MSNAKITILKYMRNNETLRLVEMEEVVSMIRRGEFREQVDAVREHWPLKGYRRREDGSSTGPEQLTKPLARLCFASQLVNRNHRRLLMGYTGLVLLEVNNLPGYAEASAIRDGAAQMPHTMLAYVGASSRSVKILCRGKNANRVHGSHGVEVACSVEPGGVAVETAGIIDGFGRIEMVG